MMNFFFVYIYVQTSVFFFRFVTDVCGCLRHRRGGDGAVDFQAEEHRSQTIYRAGKSSIWDTRLHELEDMGIGVSLYFQFLKVCGHFSKKSKKQ